MAQPFRYPITGLSRRKQSPTRYPISIAPGALRTDAPLADGFFGTAAAPSTTDTLLGYLCLMGVGA